MVALVGALTFLFVWFTQLLGEDNLFVVGFALGVMLTPASNLARTLAEFIMQKVKRT